MVRHGHAHQHLHRKKQKGPFDYVLYFFVIATPLFELPQAWHIFADKAAEQVSLSTWGFFLISSIFWWMYGVRNKLKPLVITSILYVIIEAVIVAGILKYS